jgi:hypothetical protein
LRSEGYKLSELEKEWEDLSPDAHMEILKPHPVHLVLAKHDRFIPYKFGKTFYEELSEVNPRVTCKLSNYGHIATILRYEQYV